MRKIQAMLVEHPEFQGYFVDPQTGDVWRKLTPEPDGQGYATIKVTLGQQSQTVRRHTIVLTALKGPRPTGAVCRHLDGNPANDSPSNLAWGSQTENMQDAVAHGTHYTGAKLTEHEIREIIARRRAGESGKSLAKEFGISEQRVCDYFKGRVSLKGRS